MFFSASRPVLRLILKRNIFVRFFARWSCTTTYSVLYSFFSRLLLTFPNPFYWLYFKYGHEHGPGQRVKLFLLSRCMCFWVEFLVQNYVCSFRARDRLIFAAGARERELGRRVAKKITGFRLQVICTFFNYLLTMFSGHPERSGR